MTLAFVNVRKARPNGKVIAHTMIVSTVMASSVRVVALTRRYPVKGMVRSKTRRRTQRTKCATAVHCREHKKGIRRKAIEGQVASASWFEFVLKRVWKYC